MIIEDTNPGASVVTSSLDEACPPQFTFLTGITHFPALSGLGEHLRSPALYQMISKTFSTLKVLGDQSLVIRSKYHLLMLSSQTDNKMYIFIML